MAKNIYGPLMAKNIYGPPMAKNTFIMATNRANLLKMETKKVIPRNAQLALKNIFYKLYQGYRKIMLWKCSFD